MPFDEKQFEKIVAELKEELEYANSIWGTDFDDKNTDWSFSLVLFYKNQKQI